MAMRREFGGSMAVSCPGCGLSDTQEYNGNRDELYLEFLVRFDRDEVRTGERGEGHRRIRTESEIAGMIGSSDPDGITLDVLRTGKDYISDYRVMAGPQPETGLPVHDIGLDPRLAGRLADSGIARLYRFQEKALSAITGGEDVVIEAPTASGKTEAFLIPILQMIRDRKERALALFVYPTKALARDQLPKIRRYADAVGVSAEIFDGDTDQRERRTILDSLPQVLVTNFDVIHYHLWRRTELASMLGTVRFLVVDEVHAYSGVFGSNVHHIVRRLARITGGMQIVAASATLDSAADFCSNLFGIGMTAIRGPARRGGIEFVMILPVTRNRLELMTDLTKRLVERKHRAMVFSNTHRLAEILAIRLRKSGVEIRVHRGGLSAGYRRSVEDAFRGGSLQAISCTPTLELGIDIGSVDGVVSPIIPVNRLMQRIGRAARRGQKGYAFLALGDDPISQYYGNHPEDYFDDIERLHIDPQNPFVEEMQVLAMACDRPLSGDEATGHAEAVRLHLKRGNLREAKGSYAPDYRRAAGLLSGYSIRGIGSSVDITLDGKILGNRELPAAMEELHRGAVYLLAGSKYRVIEFDYPGKRYARLERLPPDYPSYTKALTTAHPSIVKTYERRQVFGMETAFCRLNIQRIVHGYVEVEPGREAEPLSQTILDEPLRYDLDTKGIVFHAPQPADVVAQSDSPENTEASGYHAAEHIVIEGSNMITGGASRDLGGISLGASGLIFIYDGAVGGNGASRALYDRLERALARSAAIAAECTCSGAAGCPRCTFSYRCGNNNDFLHRRAALEVLRRINSGEKTRLAVPQGGERSLV